MFFTTGRKNAGIREGYTSWSKGCDICDVWITLRHEESGISYATNIPQIEDEPWRFDLINIYMNEWVKRRCTCDDFEPSYI